MPAAISSTDCGRAGPENKPSTVAAEMIAILRKDLSLSSLRPQGIQQLTRDTVYWTMLADVVAERKFRPAGLRGACRNSSHVAARRVALCVGRRATIRENVLTICPICKSEVKALDKIGDADGFDCPHHGRFKVSSTVLATKSNASRDQWEAALKRTKARQPKEWAPLIQSTDF